MVTCSDTTWSLVKSGRADRAEWVEKSGLKSSGTESKKSRVVE